MGIEFLSEEMIGWPLAALAITLARASSPLHILYTTLLAIASAMILLFVIRPGFMWISRRVDVTHRFNNGQVSVIQVIFSESIQFFVVLSVVLIFSWFVEECGLSAILGSNV